MNRMVDEEVKEKETAKGSRNNCFKINFHLNDLTIAAFHSKAGLVSVFFFWKILDVEFSFFFNGFENFLKT